MYVEYCDIIRSLKLVLCSEKYARKLAWYPFITDSLPCFPRHVILMQVEECVSIILCHIGGPEVHTVHLSPGPLIIPQVRYTAR